MTCEISRGYDVSLVRGVLSPRNRALADSLGHRRALVVTDPTVEAIHGADLRTYLGGLPNDVDVHVTQLAEGDKSIGSVLAVCEAAQRHGIGRRDLLVAFGGGVCCDVVSLAASLIRRGVPYVCLPTTLVAQIDAGIGLKGGVNFGGSKNYLGCFTPPQAVLVDPTFLLTVPEAELRGGISEIVKMALVRDRRLFDQLLDVGPELLASGFSRPATTGEAVIARAVQLMLDELSRNCYEEGRLDRLVDFGHTFSGRLEELSAYTLRHGEAVAVDMALSSAIAVELGLLGEADLHRILSALLALGLPVRSPLATPATLMEAMRAVCLHRDGALNLVVPTTVGEATFVRRLEDVPLHALTAAVSRVAAAAANTPAVSRLDDKPLPAPRDVIDLRDRLPAARNSSSSR
jgi:3-dehydroquinate synthase